MVGVENSEISASRSKPGALPLSYTPLNFGWHTWARTKDLPIISRLLYHLSYVPTISLYWCCSPGSNGTPLDFQTSVLTTYELEQRIFGNKKGPSGVSSEWALCRLKNALTLTR